MADNKRKRSGVTKYADHDVIVVSNGLKKRVMRRFARNEPDPLADAERALEELSAQFGNWMEDECQALEDARQSINQKGLTIATRQALFRAAHDIKGHSTMFGYPMATDVADSLCRVIEHTPESTLIPLPFIDQCVDAIRAIIREHNDENAEETATELALELRALADNMLGVDTDLDGTVDTSPPLAPE